MAYKSKFRPKNPHKYLGNIDHIICRSTWESQLAKWADRNKAVLKWGVEYIVIRYYDKGNGRTRRYFTDFYFEFRDGTKRLVEVKPQHETLPPPVPKRKTRKYLEKVQRYATNISKWDAAKMYCEKRGDNTTFEIWTENHLKQLGLRLI